MMFVRGLVRSKKSLFSALQITKNSLGFSLVGVTVAAGVLGIIVLVIAEIFKVSNTSFQTIRMSNDMQTVQNLVQLSLSEPEICREALRVGNGDPKSPLASYNFPYQDPPVAKVNLTDIQLKGKTLLNTLGGYKINAKLFSPEADGVNIQLVDRADGSLKTFKKYSVIVMLYGIRNDDDNGNVAMRARIPMSLITGPNGAATFYDCSSSFQDYKAMCEVLGGQYDGGQTPPCLLKKLGIANSFKTRTDLESKFPNMGLLSQEGAVLNDVIIGHSSPLVDMAYPYESIGVGTPAHNLRLQSPGPIGFHTGMTATEPDDNSKMRMIINKVGNLGIGVEDPSERLDVNGYVRVRSTNMEGGTIRLDGHNGVNMHVENFNGNFRLVDGPWKKELFTVTQGGNVSAAGEIKPGNSGEECSGGKAGAIRYNAGGAFLEFCDGRSWKSIFSSLRFTKEYSAKAHLSLEAENKGRGPNVDVKKRAGGNIISATGWHEVSTATHALCVLSGDNRYTASGALEMASNCRVTGSPGNTWTLRADMTDGDGDPSGNMSVTCAATCYD